MIRKVSFKNKAGFTLFGSLHIPENKFKLSFPAVIVCHGLSGSKDAEHIEILSERLEQEGFIVLRFDFTGCGESEGSYDEMTVSREVADLETALEALLTFKEVDRKRIAVIGHSFGGSVAIITASEDRKIKAIATIGASYDQVKVLHNLCGMAQMKHWKEKGAITIAGEEEFKLKYSFFEDASKYNILSVAKKIKIPFLVAHGGADMIVSSAQAKEIARDTCAHLVIVPGEHHPFGKPTVEVVARWLKKHL